ncbi:MAG: anaerobic ribonucleoside-triphosphate reductase activating protein [Paludibacteraceae bacterium]|nr:anaerobic ribonucleoside-triphosphate reductase activating protein [Paludibacteraceae bacterium]
MCNYSSVKYNCATNGTGVRTAVYLSGCSIHCPGCFNKEQWDFANGEKLTNEVIDKIMDSLDFSYIDGLSILGGEPLDEKNVTGTLRLCQALRKRYGKTKNIWVWTGYQLDDVRKRCKDILSEIDVLVDGPFVLDESHTKAAFRGSSNQRILLQGKDF